MKKRRQQETETEIEEAVSQISKGRKKINQEDPGKLLPSGITLFDLITAGGNPWGRIVNIVGDSASGKTYLTLEILAHAHRLLGDKLKWVYDDCEGGFSFDTKAMYGFEVIPDDFHPSVSVEEFSGRLSREISNLRKEESLIYIIDSLDGLSSEAERKRDVERQKALEAGKEYDKGTYAMEKQKFMSEFFRLRAGEIAHKNILVIIISQVRENIGVMFGEKYKRSGGKALDFYASTIIWLAVSEKHEKKGRKIGTTIKALTKKARIKTPFRECYLKLLFDYGIDNLESNINFLYDLISPTGKDTYKKKTKLVWDDEEFSRDGLIAFIEKNDLEGELETRVVEKWQDIEDSISSEGRKPKWIK